MEQIIANPEPGEYLLDKEVVLKRDKDERQYRNEKGNWQSIKVNLLRIHANKQITLEYYHKELPKFEIQPFLVKHRPIIDNPKSEYEEFDEYGTRIKYVFNDRHCFFARSAYFFIDPPKVYIYYKDKFGEELVKIMQFSADLAQFGDFSKQNRPLVYKSAKEEYARDN